MKIQMSTVTEPARFIAATVTYCPATDHRGSRVKITLPRFKKSRVIPFDHVFNNSADNAADFLTRHGVKIAGTAETAGNDLLLITWDQLPALEFLFNF